LLQVISYRKLAKKRVELFQTLGLKKNLTSHFTTKRSFWTFGEDLCPRSARFSNFMNIDLAPMFLK